MGSRVQAGSDLFTAATCQDASRDAIWLRTGTICSRRQQPFSWVSGGGGGGLPQPCSEFTVQHFVLRKSRDILESPQELQPSPAQPSGHREPAGPSAAWETPARPLLPQGGAFWLRCLAKLCVL